MTTGNLGGNFGAGEYKDEYQPLPVDRYKLAITDTVMKPTKANPSVSYLQVEMEIQEGQYQGRKMFNRLNLQHGDDKVRKIAQVELEKIATAIGKVVQNHEDLRGTPFYADVVIEASKDAQYSDSNRIKKYYPATVGALPQATGTAPAVGPWGK